MMKKRFLLLLSGLILFVLLVGCSSGGKNKSLTIASKTFTENILLSEIYAQLVESHTEIEVVRQPSLGSTQVCYTAMENGEIDFYVEYTGTIYNEILKFQHDRDITTEEVYTLTKQEMNSTHNMKLYRPIGINNTFALAMEAEKAGALGVETISDIRPFAPRLIFAANSQYYPRVNDGFDALMEKYGLDFKSAVKMDYNAVYEAVSVGQVDVAILYATDALLKKYNMKTLVDDKQIFLAYQGVPMIRNEVLKKYPELDAVLDLLANRIDDEYMRELNYAIDVEGQQPAEVAEAFLRKEGLMQ